MAACLTELEWRREAAKMVVLIADAPPHGESGTIPSWSPRLTSCRNRRIRRSSVSHLLRARRYANLGQRSRQATPTVRITVIQRRLADILPGHDPLVIARTMAQHGIVLVSRKPPQV